MYTLIVNVDGKTTESTTFNNRKDCLHEFQQAFAFYELSKYVGDYQITIHKTGVEPFVFNKNKHTWEDVVQYMEV